MITVIIPARNAQETIQESIESVLACPQVSEIIVVNDGSTDQTQNKINDIRQSCALIKCIQGPRRGISAALNAGIFEASKPYLARCDSDDLFDKSRFNWQLPFLEAHSDYVGICSGFLTIDERSKTIAHMSLREPSKEITDELIRGCVTTHLGTWLTRTQALKDLSGAREWFESAEDIDLQFRLAACGRVWQEQSISYMYRLHSKSITHSMVSIRREFFDRCAHDFALQRLHGQDDDLALGRPPEKPSVSNGKQIKTSGKHIAGLLQGEAWRLFAKGERVNGLKKIIWAIKLTPTNTALWSNLITIMVKKIPS